MSSVARLTGTVIGGIQEARYHRKEKKLAAKGEHVNDIDYPQSPNGVPGHPSLEGRKAHDDDDDDESDEDEEQWALDDAAAEFEASHDHLPSYDAAVSDPNVSLEDVYRSFKNQHKKAFSVDSHTEGPLPLPVIIPQRRPKDKARGFVKAYAPILGEYKGIDQNTFMNFLIDFDRASRVSTSISFAPYMLSPLPTSDLPLTPLSSRQASPVFDVVNGAALLAGSIPNPLTASIAFGVQVAASTAKEVQARYRTNNYLNMMNEYLFKPHGLYAMVMTYKPDSPGKTIVSVDINDTIKSSITKANDVPDSAMQARMKKLRISSGKTVGGVHLPEAAPLIYPGLDAALASTGKQKKPNRVIAGRNFVEDYLDHRSQAAFAYQNPGTKLATMPEQQFHSKFSDPNHPMYAGGVMTFLSGGKIDSGAWKRERRVRRAERRAAKAGLPPLTEEEKLMIRRRPTGFMGRMMGQDVLYLLIANLPTDDEMDLARHQLAEAKARKQREKIGIMDDSYPSLASNNTTTTTGESRSASSSSAASSVFTSRNGSIATGDSLTPVSSANVSIAPPVKPNKEDWI